MISIKKNNFTYIIGDYILKNAPIYSKGIRSTRDLIKKKNIPKEKCIYAKLKDNMWNITDGKSVKFDKVFVEETFVYEIPEINNLSETIIKDDKGIEKAPEIIDLDNSQKFKDADGNIVEIETRGECSIDKIFFKLKDIMQVFELENLNKNIKDKKSYFKTDEHYKYFNCEKVRKKEKKTSNNNNIANIKKEIFLTYEGVLRVLFSSHSSKTKQFIKWATETLFTIQIGNEDDKKELASSILGVNPKTIKDVFKTNTAKTPCVYLYLIGNAKKLLDNSNKYKDDDLLCKYGCTDDLPRRSQEHHKTFSKEFGVDVELIFFSIIEAKYIFNAETNITQYFKSNLVEYKNMIELIVINKKELSQIKQHYSMIQKNYIGRYEEMNEKIKQMEKEIIGFETQLVLKDKEIETLKDKHKIELMEVKHKNDLDEERHKLELQNKEIELLNYKIKLLEKK